MRSFALVAFLLHLSIVMAIPALHRRGGGPGRPPDYDLAPSDMTRLWQDMVVEFQMCFHRCLNSIRKEEGKAKLTEPREPPTRAV